MGGGRRRRPALFILILFDIIKTTLIQAVFHISDRFWEQQNRHTQNWKTFFFQQSSYSLKAHAYYFTVLIHLATWKADKVGIFTDFTSINLPWCSQSINSLMYVYLLYAFLAAFYEPFISVACVIAWLHFFVLVPPAVWKKNSCIYR